MMTNIPRPQRRDENLLDVSQEQLAIDRAVEHPGGGHSVATKGANKG